MYSLYVIKCSSIIQVFHGFPRSPMRIASVTWGRLGWVTDANRIGDLEVTDANRIGDLGTAWISDVRISSMAS